MSFNKLTLTELARTANEDFAFELSDEEKKSKKLALAAFTEAGLKFSDYLLANPEQVEKFAPKETAVEEAVQTERVTPVVAARPNYNTVEPHLIKMVRDNPLYEIGKYRFTEDHPYVLVDASDAQRVLNNEGFRAAFPDELDEFYN